MNVLHWIDSLVTIVHTWRKTLRWFRSALKLKLKWTTLGQMTTTMNGMYVNILKQVLFGAVELIHFSFIHQTSRASSPDNDFVDVESTIDNRPHSSASVSLLKQSGPQLISPMPEVKRNRGRPRKLKDPSTINDDSKVYRVKRGRGRPRKNSLNSNLSNTQNSYLEEGTSTKLLSFTILFSRTIIL